MHICILLPGHKAPGSITATGMKTIPDTGFITKYIPIDNETRYSLIFFRSNLNKGYGFCLKQKL
jgi:hypothetical protein